MENGRAEPHAVTAVGGAWRFLIRILGLLLSVSAASGVDLEAAWEAQLRGRPHQAQQLLGVDFPETAPYRLTAAMLALELGELDRANAALEPITADAGHPDFAEAALLLGRVHLANGLDAAARKAFNASLERSSDGPYAAVAHLELIRLDLQGGAFDAAAQRLRWLVELGPSPELELAAGLLHPKSGTRMVRLFPSPVALFAAARLSDGVVMPPVSAVQMRVEASARAPDASSGVQDAGLQSGLQPVHVGELKGASVDSVAASTDVQSEEPRTGLRPVYAAPVIGPWRFTVRLGSFREPVNAQHMMKALRDDDFDARIVVEGSFSQVFGSAASTRKESEELLEQLRSLGYDGDVIRVPTVVIR